MNGNESPRGRNRPGRVIIGVLATLVILANAAFLLFSGYADMYLGRGEAVITPLEGTSGQDSQYVKRTFADADLKPEAEKLVEQIEAEGAVLLKNEGTLPLGKQIRKITLLGRDAADPVYGGSGSGSVDLSSVVSLRTGLEAQGFQVNPVAWKALEDYASFTLGKNMFGGDKRIYTHPKADIVMDSPAESRYEVGEMPVNGYTQAVKASFADYHDAAIIMIGRGGGEGGDLARDMKGFEPNYTPGQHQLEPNKDELDLIALAREHFDTVVVLVNASTPMELGALQSDPGVDAILWVGSPGQTGFRAVAKILDGTVNPSGRTADIYPADFTKDPTFANFGNFAYTNVNKDNSAGDGFFVQYEEGIYYGYRYYETAAAEGFIDYDTAVVYPFGYGLSYTDFAWEVTGQRSGDVHGTLAVDVKVTNKGTVAGKDVVQLYYSAPYTRGGIEKSAVVLGAFAKTGLLAPGESQTLTLALKAQDMASYDWQGHKAWVMDKGTYVLSLRTDSHHVKEGTSPLDWNLADTVAFSGDNRRTGDISPVTNRFDDVNAAFSPTPVSGKITLFSRADFAGTFPTAPAGADFTADASALEGFRPWDTKARQNAADTMPVTGAQNGLSLINMRGKSFDDPLWETFLDQLNPADVATIINSAAYNTLPIDSLGKPATVDLDGPAGISNFMGKAIKGIAWTSEVVMASTFNADLVKEMGRMIGEEALAYGVHGWYAPAMNLHRAPFAGRNFEYYSEDPFLSGIMGTAAVEGAAEKGVYAFIKHFALNDQETNRVNNGVATWAHEQAIREIYLRPFEITVKNAKSTVEYIADAQGTRQTAELPATRAVMSSFNRVGSVWSGGSRALQTGVLREEWGFRGVVISDFNLYPYMNVNQAMQAGTDINITFAAMKPVEDTASPTAVRQIRTIAHRLLYTVANSNAMNGILPGSVVTYTMAPWQTGLLAGDIIAVLVLGLGLFLVIRRSRKG